MIVSCSLNDFTRVPNTIIIIHSQVRRAEAVQGPVPAADQLRYGRGRWTLRRLLQEGRQSGPGDRRHHAVRPVDVGDRRGDGRGERAVHGRRRRTVAAGGARVAARVVRFAVGVSVRCKFGKSCSKF